ncbi:NAD(P)/FAD-dependent oxidoreductase [Streptosporangium sp. NBC_01755]|uniref:NAD(P)/FAD-dependent oxidoreductase n=1 Tax=Streptosporangium sp. NBC_01755 TaxID=2975949 RepID=UPI002DD850A1|nr:NAD(P)/FAD-dependent oxidoreductase [Streptosporangium sp. NBC_01755]WSC99942.1 NAD(P)/FAD-dependent oxidoreductase [Streptosporangium sp. NBC_01755]
MNGRIRRRSAYGVGAALIIMGFTGLLLEADRTDPLGWALWFGGLIVAHDALIVPLVLLAGAATAWLREPFLSPVRAALVTAGILCLVALPAVLGIGRRADNPSLLPLDYGRNLAAVLAVIALAAACAMVVSRLRTRPRERTRVLLGAVAGLAGGLIIGSLMAYQGMVGPAGWASFVVHAVILGAVLGAVAGERARDLATAFSCGILVGLLDWVVWHLTLRPLLAGEIPTWTITSGDRSFHVLVGNVLLGGITGALLYGALTAHRLAATRSAPAAPVAPPRVVIVGGGFGGVSTARRLDRHAARGLHAEVTLISDTNALLFTPMLAGVASSALEPRHVSAPVRAALSHTAFLHGHVDAIDTVRRVVHVTTGEEGMAAVPYEHLVLAVGSVPHYFDLPGLAEHAFALKTIGDATRLRNHVLGALEDADLEPDPVRRAQLLTIVVAGGGFAGTELIAELFDLVHGVLHQYPNIRDREPRFVLVHAGEGILPELSAELGAYALEKLRGRGIEFHLKTRVAEASPGAVRLSDGQTIPTCTLAWTAGNRPHPLAGALPAEHGRGGSVVADPFLRVTGIDGLWAIGDCARIPGTDGLPCPPTAQHALREGRTAADNIAAVLRGRPPAEFRFRGLGILVALGHRTAVAEIRGHRLSGLLAWIMWRAIYLAKLPGGERKVRVLADWLIDLAFPRDITLTPSPPPSRLGTTPAPPAGSGEPGSGGEPGRPEGPAPSLPGGDHE